MRRRPLCFRRFSCPAQPSLRLGNLRCCKLATSSQSPPSLINQGLVRFRDEKFGAKEADHDARTDRVIEEILSVGEAFFGGVTWRGKRCMRISVSNWQTSDNDVDRAVEAVARAIDRASRSPAGAAASALTLAG